MIPALKSRLRTASSEVSCVSLFRSPTFRSTPSFLRPNPPRRKRDNSPVHAILHSMTPPIHVHDAHAVDFVYSLISDFHDRQDKSLSETQILSGGVECYALSYRHEACERSERISLERLTLALHVVRSHCRDIGKKFYSIWLDSLSDPTSLPPTATWVDVGLPPFALFRTVAIPSEAGFTSDMTRAWIRCEHQLAATGRGLLTHPSQRPPPWVDGRRVSSGPGYRLIHGMRRSADKALYDLACAICWGLLVGGECGYKEDMDDLSRWAFLMVGSERWRDRVVCCDSGVAEDEESVIRSLLDNMSEGDVGSGNGGVVVMDELPMIRPEAKRRVWDGALELLESLSRQTRTCVFTNMNSKLREEIRKRSLGLLLTFTNGQEKGIYTCLWSGGGMPLALELDMVNEEDDSRSIVGYRVIYDRSIREELAKFWDICQWRRACTVGEVVCSRKRCAQFTEALNNGLLVYGEAAVDQLAVADCGKWFVGMK